MLFTDKELDYTFVAVSEVPKLNYRAINPIAIVSSTLKARDYVCIVQFPRGQEQKDSYADVIEVSECGKFVYYACDTDYGSSGSPISMATMFWRYTINALQRRTQTEA
jgi:hypothetical protein